MTAGRGALRAALGAGSLVLIVVLVLSAGAPGARDAASLSAVTKMRQLHHRTQELLAVTYGATRLGDTGTETGNLVQDMLQDFSLAYLDSLR
jgi:hypothetical protein